MQDQLLTHLCIKEETDEIARDLGRRINCTGDTKQFHIVVNSTECEPAPAPAPVVWTRSTQCEPSLPFTAHQALQESTSTSYFYARSQRHATHFPCNMTKRMPIPHSPLHAPLPKRAALTSNLYLCRTEPQYELRQLCQICLEKRSPLYGFGMPLTCRWLHASMTKGKALRCKL